MKPTVVLPRRYAGAGSILLTLSLFITSGCSDSGQEGGDGADRAARRYGMDRSEFIAIKKAHVGKPKAFKNALLKRSLQQGRLVEETNTPGKTTTNAR